MNPRLVDPAVSSMLDEAERLPESAVRNALLERAACAAEALLDLDTAWRARCTVLSSSASHENPRFETLFMSLAWCLAVSDREPDRFPASEILWQYKWVAFAAPNYARVPRTVLNRLIDDMDARFVREGWGRRAGLHKRVELFHALGELERAKALVEEWRAVARDRGSDCMACEISSMAELLADIGDVHAALREARPIMLGRLSCSTVPQSTFGNLLLPLILAGELKQARDMYDRGRRLVAAMDEGGVLFAAPYFVGAAFFGEISHARSILRSRLPQAAGLQSDCDRTRWFGQAAFGLELLAASGVEELELPLIPRLVHEPVSRTTELATAFRSLAASHAQLLDARNGNSRYTNWLAALKCPPDPARSA